MVIELQPEIRINGTLTQLRTWIDTADLAATIAHPTIAGQKVNILQLLALLKGNPALQAQCGYLPAHIAAIRAAAATGGADPALVAIGL